MQKHGPMHIWAKLANAREQIIITSPGGRGASSPWICALLEPAAATLTASPWWRVPSSQTWGPRLWRLYSLDPKGAAFSRFLRFKVEVSVLKIQPSRRACFSFGSWRKLSFWCDIIQDVASLWVHLFRSRGNRQETPTLMGWNEVSLLTLMVWN